jgi:hypothetical protein
VRRACLILLCIAGCGRAPAPPAASPAVSELRGGYPAVQWIPADATYAMVAVRLRDAAAAARELVAAIGLFADEDVEAADREMRGELGISLLAEPDLTGIGLDPDGSVAVFSRGLFPTAVVEVAAPDQLRAYLDSRRPDSGVSVRRLDGHDVYTWHDDELAVSWALIDDWFAVRIYDPRRDTEPLGWVVRMLADARSAGFAGQADVSAALASARRRLPPPAPIEDPLFVQPARAASPGLFGLVRIGRLIDALPADVAGELAPCRPLMPPDGRLSFAADMSWRSGDGVIEVALAPAAARALGAALAPPPPPGFVAFARDAAVRLELGLDLAWLDELARTAGCPLLPPLPERPRVRMGAGKVSGYHLAAGTIRPEERSARVAVHLSLRDPSFVRELLDRIPMRRQLESDARVGGREVKVVSVPLFPRLRYRLTERSFTAATGDGVMEALLAPSPAAEPGRTVLAAALRPARIPDQAELFEKLARAAGIIGHRVFQRTEARLGRYQLGRVRLSLEEGVLVLRAGMRGR